MAFHSSLQDSDSEVCLADTILEDDPKYNEKLDFAEDCLNAEVTIPDVVWRGTKLSEKKPKPDKTKHEYFVPDVFGSFVKHPRERRGHLGASRKNIRPMISPPGSRCVCIRPTPAASTYLSTNRGSRIITVPIVPKIKTKKGKRCPIRIAELAVPTKRQCIETWRDKSDILPVYMIERLKKRVMDQTPIAGIPEAIYCFQSGRLVVPKNLQNLSNIVSSDIAKIMYKSQSLFDKDQEYKAIHKDVSNTITVWITGILGDLSDRLLEEELRVKNEIKVQEEAQIETMIQFYEQFNAISDTIKEQENKQSKDLEEEEGPVLDFIDDVVYNVLNICDPPQLHYAADSSASSSCQELFGEDSEKLLEALDKKEIFNSEEFVQSDGGGQTEDAVTDSQKFFTDSEHFRNEIIDIIDNFSKESEDGTSNGSGDDMENEGILLKSEMEHDINIRTSEEVLPNADMRHDINDGNNEEVSANTEVEHNLNDENIDQIDDDSRNLKENDDANDNLEETRSNVSERLEIFTDDIDNDKNSKILLFPNTDLVNPDNPADQINTSTTGKPALESDEYKQPRWNSRTNKPNIMFSEPNQDLLSDADESWPYDLSNKLAVKVSEIASKSVLSLGNITERDEKRMTSQEEEEDTSSMIDIATDDAKLQANDSMKKIDSKLPTETHGKASLGNITEHDQKQMTSQEEDNMTDIGADGAILQANYIMKKRDFKLPTEKYGTASQSNEPLIKVPIGTSSSEPSFTKYVSKIKMENDIDKTITVPKTTKYQEHQTDSGESELKRTDSSTDWTEDDRIPRQKSPSLSVDYGWKVHTKTAPSWVTASMWGQGRGEPSDDSIPIQIKPTRVKESELRKWCKNLRDAFINLEVWSSWISATCKETIILLKQKESACPGLARRAVINWIRLNRNVRKDALLWTKLYQRTNKNFENFKRKYDNIEIVAAEYRAMCACVKTNH